MKRTVLAVTLLGASGALAQGQPTPEMMAPVERIAHFIATHEAGDLAAFASGDVMIVENFAPYLFSGKDAVRLWADGMRKHTAPSDALAHRFGPAQDFSTSGERAYFSLPTRWTGRVGSQGFVEDGGWSFVLVREDDEWRVQGYGWAVTRLEVLP